MLSPSLLLSLWLLAQNTSTLHGQILRAGSSEPVGDVEISLVFNSPGISARPRTITNAQGSFTFDNLPAGKYSVQARREGYFNDQGNPLPTLVANVTVEPLRSQQIVVSLIPGAIISGRVTDTEGRALAGVQMSAMKLQYDEGRPVFSAGSL